jgi:pimeloyl-ACP methyl ester carboxylesterase
MGPTIVFVHGAWGRPDDWDEVVIGLPPDVQVRRADLPTCRRPDATLGDDVEAVTALIEDAGDVVLVGHSYGGYVITAAGVHPSVRHLVYVAAYMPDENESMAVARQSGDPAAAEAPEPEPVSDAEAPGDPSLGGRLDGTIVLDDWEVDDGSYSPEAMMRKRARPRRPWAARAMHERVTAVAWRRVPTTYVVATRDDAIPPDVQRRHAERADHLVELDTPHFPSFERPDELAAVIRDVLDRI